MLPRNSTVIDTTTGCRLQNVDCNWWRAADPATLAGLDIGVSPAVRLHIIPNVRVDMWRPTGTTNQLGFYSEAATTILQVVGVP